MKAIILLDDADSTNGIGEPTAKQARWYANVCIAMGIEITYLRSFGSGGRQITAAIMETYITSMDADLVILGLIASSNWSEKRNILDTGLSVPVFAGSGNYWNASGFSGTSAVYAGDLTTDDFPATIVGGGSVMTHGIRLTLSTGTAIIQGTGSDTSAVGAWSHYPSGKAGVYMENVGSDQTVLPILMQKAIDDGNLAVPPKRAPILLTIDHISHGDSGSSGTQLQPEIIATLGNILRSQKGVCYASLEQNQDGDVTAAQTTNFVEYSDVFKYIACHDHSANDLTNTGYTKGSGLNDCIDNQESITDITASYAATKTHIESLGLTVSTDLAHFAGNSIGPNGWKVMETMGFKAARGGNGGASDNSEFFPNIQSNNAHWMGSNMTFRGVRMLGGSTDAGIDNGDAVDLAKDFSAYRWNMQQIAFNRMAYHHATDFEEPEGGTIFEGDEVSRGVLSWQYGATIANYCKDTINFGADINEYL